ncbi:hypothetical protein LJK88_48825 [Paenibacillus sp. P26]|nr:hypothetical protein LJK88_48825 [Paenibacillus sp. P26]UUZ91628.1 hypothetical protein LJK87_39505 [Paenibacillus sp. P25]
MVDIRDIIAFIFLLVITLTLLRIEVRIKKQMENQERLIGRLDLMINQNHLKNGVKRHD